MDFKIDKDLEAFIPRPTEEEVKNLEELILADGVKDPLTVWDEKNLLVDGHTRLGICQKHNLEYPVDRVSFPSRDHVIAWMVKNQMGRRNLTPEVASYLRGKRYEAERGIRGGDRGNQHTKCNELPKSQNGTLAKEDKTTSRALGEEYGVSKTTINRDFSFSKAVDKISAMHKDPAKIKGEILSGKKKITKKAIKDIALVAESDEDLAKEQFKEAVAPKKRKAKTKKEPESQPAQTEDETTQPPKHHPSRIMPKDFDEKNMVTGSMWIIEIVISQLTRIEDDDPQKDEAFDRVIQWIEEHR